LRVLTGSFVITQNVSNKSNDYAQKLVADNLIRCKFSVREVSYLPKFSSRGINP
jgi:hypothetical protein